ncbi:hypothetical protein SCP_0510460 [Sparassis crispa]|uniref:Pentatricopeptide repeat-containing protein n=1 Tax=Sparassis crispa TaxID=139825 RepID=A0A401GP39_9APHY|nr:hypothetical protein SCP_0510460 [Sparassis crispa]GBE83987.1 hypothetical protein SCP_0510460 [Sparassis crispa]
MASWVLGQAPWTSLARVRLRFEAFSWPAKQYAWSKNYFSSPLLSQETPAVLELKKQPYPSSPLDSSVFEDMNADYGYEAVAPPTPARRPCNLLVQLVKDQQYADVEQVYAELLEMGVEIRPSSVYYDMALRALEDPDKSPHARMMAFTKWWSLVPPIMHRYRVNVTKVQEIILEQNPFPDPLLIAWFTVISASKGYAYLFGVRAVTLVVRYADPSFSSSFLYTLHQTTLQWLQSLAPRKRERYEPLYEQLFQEWYAFAVRQHCMTGRVDAAVALLRDARSRNVNIDNFTYDFLKGKLRRRRDSINLLLVEQFQRTDVPSGLNPTVSRPPLDLLEEPSLYELDRTVSPTPFDSVKDSSATWALRYWSFSGEKSLVSALRDLRHSMTNSRYPNPVTFAEFMDAYRASGRSVALGILRKQSYSNSFATASWWALSEMMYHYRRQEYALVLLAYAHHFHLVGIPAWLSQHLSTLEKLAQDSRYGRRVIPLYPVPQKHWPMSQHTSLVWRAVVELTAETSGALESLYQELLSQVAASQGAVTTGSLMKPEPLHSLPRVQDWSIPSADEYPAAIPPPTSFDDAHFNVFIRAFINKEGAGPARAIQVIDDMYRFGFKVSVHSLTPLVSAFAREGEQDRLKMLLSRMEESLPSETPAEDSVAEGEGDVAGAAGVAPENALPAPNVVTYTAIIWAFIRTYQYQEATEFVEQLKEKGRYVPGTNRRTDLALAVLKERIRMGGGFEQGQYTLSSPSGSTDYQPSRNPPLQRGS